MAPQAVSAVGWALGLWSDPIRVCWGRGRGRAQAAAEAAQVKAQEGRWEAEVLREGLETPALTQALCPTSHLLSRTLR